MRGCCQVQKVLGFPDYEKLFCFKRYCAFSIHATENMADVSDFLKDLGK